MTTKGQRYVTRGSLAARLLDFFDANPEEELTMADIVTKFEVTGDAVRTALAYSLRNNGVEYAKVIRLTTKAKEKAKGIAS